MMVRRSERTVVEGIHDMGGVEGFGRPDFTPNERATVDQRWEAVAGAAMFALLRSGRTNLDAHRHRIERLDPERYLTIGYWGRWLAAVEAAIVEQGVAETREIEARIVQQGHEPAHSAAPPRMHPPVALESRSNAPDFLRSVDREPRFSVGQAVTTSTYPPHRGHHRLPRYCRGRRGTVARVYPAFTFPDTMAHDQGESPCHVYAVRFEATELWGPDADPVQQCHLDLFEPYLQPIDAPTGGQAP
jgi:nitrile hydratase